METRVPSKVVSFRHFFEGPFWHHLFLGRLDTVWLVISLFIEYQYHHLGWLSMTLHVHMMHMTSNRATFDFKTGTIVCSTYQCTNAPMHLSGIRLDSAIFPLSCCQIHHGKALSRAFPSVSSCSWFSCMQNSDLPRAWSGGRSCLELEWFSSPPKNDETSSIFFCKDTLKNHKSCGKKALHAGGVWVWPLRPRVAMLMANRNRGKW